MHPRGQGDGGETGVACRVGLKIHGGERVCGKRRKNKHEAHAGHRLAPVFSPERTARRSRPPRLAPVSLHPMPGPSALPAPTLRPHPSRDQIWPLSFCLAAPFQGIKASVSGNTDSSGDPRGQLWEFGQGSRLFSPPPATFLHHLPGARHLVTVKFQGPGGGFRLPGERRKQRRTCASWRSTGEAGRGL